MHDHWVHPTNNSISNYDIMDGIRPLIFIVTLVTLMCALTCAGNREPVLAIDTDYSDTMHLASIINAECGICDESEQKKTGSVVLNRVDSELFPDDIFCVITQDNQFSGYCTQGYYPSVSSLKISKDLLKGMGRVDEILYFWNPNYTTDTIFLKQMQDRILYKEKHHYYAY